MVLPRLTPPPPSLLLQNNQNWHQGILPWVQSLGPFYLATAFHKFPGTLLPWQICSEFLCVETEENGTAGEKDAEKDK